MFIYVLIEGRKVQVKSYGHGFIDCKGNFYTKKQIRIERID